MVDTQKKERIIYSIFENLLLAGLFLLCLYALHDMQTSEGIGLFFSLHLGVKDRKVFDYAVDILCMGIFLLLLYWPCFYLGYQKKASYLRLLIGYLAIVPQLSLARILHLWSGDINFLWETDLTSGIAQWIFWAARSLQMWLPLSVILFLGRYCSIKAQDGHRENRNAEEHTRNPMYLWEKGIWIVPGILLVAALLVPATQNLAGFLVGYLGLLLAFECWENMIRESIIFKKWSFVLFGLMLLKGIYRILILVSMV